jgi:hypothetical protein
MIEKHLYEEIRGEYGPVASWAVWEPQSPGGRPKSNMGPKKVFNLGANPSLLQTLRNDIVMVGLNFSREVEFTHPFSNFHDESPNANDFKIRHAFSRTQYYGAYMTDVLKKRVILRARDVRQYIKNNPSDVQCQMRAFEKELDDLQSKKPMLLAFGGDVYGLLNRYLEKDRYSVLIRLTHYSHYVGMEKYRNEVLSQISEALRKPSNRAELASAAEFPVGIEELKKPPHQSPSAGPTLSRVDMNKDIKAIVEQCPLLHFKVNKGERHRIMRSGTKRGSLWVVPRTNGYCITPTGELEERMSNFLKTNFGRNSGEDYKGRWKWWNIKDLGGVARVIQHFGEP